MDAAAPAQCHAIHYIYRGDAERNWTRYWRSGTKRRGIFGDVAVTQFEGRRYPVYLFPGHLSS